MARFLLLVAAAVCWFLVAFGAHAGGVSFLWLGAALIVLAFAVDGGIPFRKGSA